MAKDSVNIPIGDKYVITADGCSFILKEVKVAKSGPKKGEIQHNAVGYFQSLSGLGRGLITREVRESDIASLEQMQARIEELGAGIAALLTELINTSKVKEDEQ